MQAERSKAHVGRLLSDYSSTVRTGPVQSGEAKLSDLVRAIRSVPVAPEVLPKLQAKLKNLDTDTADLAALIKLDAGLASAVLRTSNSAYYARSSSITDLDEAVVLIGYQETLRLVARCSFATVMQNSLDQYALSGEVLWREALLTAFAMEELCQIAGVDSSGGYIAGLLHGVGMVAINDYLTKRSHPVSPPLGRTAADFVPWELQTIGHHHGHVGAAMMRAWQMPAAVVESVEGQFNPVSGSESLALRCLLPVAITIAHRVAKIADGEDGEEIHLDADRAQRVGLSGQHLEDTAAEVEIHWQRAKGALA